MDVISENPSLYVKVRTRIQDNDQDDHLRHGYVLTTHKSQGSRQTMYIIFIINAELTFIPLYKGQKKSNNCMR